MKALVPFLIIALCVGAYFLYISPTLPEIDVLKVKKAQYTDILEKAKELKDMRDAALTEYNNISEDNLARLNKIIPKKFNSTLFANDVNAIASKHGMSVSWLKVENSGPEAHNGENTDTSQGEVYKTISASFKVSGQYEKFIDFIKDLETNLELVDVVSLSVKQVGGDKILQNFQDYSVEINTYSL